MVLNLPPPTAPIIKNNYSFLTEFLVYLSIDIWNIYLPETEAHSFHDRKGGENCCETKILKLFSLPATSIMLTLER